MPHIKMTAYERGWRDAAAGSVWIQMYKFIPGYRNGYLAQLNHDR